jgi:hypothetical protein
LNVCRHFWDEVVRVKLAQALGALAPALCWSTGAEYANGCLKGWVWCSR